MTIPKKSIFGLIYLFYVFITTIFGVVFVIVPIFPLHFIFPRYFQAFVDYFVGLWICSNATITQLFGSKLYVYSTEMSIDESSIIIMNHKNRLDWFFYFILSCWYQNPKRLKIALKNELKYIPGPGWACQFACYLFLNRNWELDKLKLIDYINYFRRISCPIQLLVFCEGTNFCPETKLSSDRYAVKNNAPIYNHVLHPRVTGFRYITQLLAGKDSEKPLINCIYDATVAYRGEAHGEYDLLAGKFTKEVHIHVEKFSIDSISMEDDKLEKWLKDRWTLKEKSLENFYKTGEFLGNPPLLPPKSTGTNVLIKNIFFNSVIVLIPYLFYHIPLLLKCSFILTLVALGIFNGYLAYDNIIIRHFTKISS